MGQDMDTLPLLISPNSKPFSKSDNTWLGDKYDHQGETRKKVQIQSMIIHNPTQCIITIFMPKTLTPSFDIEYQENVP